MTKKILFFIIFIFLSCHPTKESMILTTSKNHNKILIQDFKKTKATDSLNIWITGSISIENLNKNNAKSIGVLFSNKSKQLSFGSDVIFFKDSLYNFNTIINPFSVKIPTSGNMQYYFAIKKTKFQKKDIITYLSNSTEKIDTMNNQSSITVNNLYPFLNNNIKLILNKSQDSIYIRIYKKNGKLHLLKEAIKY